MDDLDGRDRNQGFVIDVVQRGIAERRPTYDEVLRVPDLSFGIYTLPAGSEDEQQPHTEDEVYSVVLGRAALDIDGIVHPVEAGSVAFVAAGTPHRFVDITEDLHVLVVFGPAEHSRKAGPR